MKVLRFLPDTFTMMLVATVLLATFLPARGIYITAFNDLTIFAIGLLFFMHGAKLSRAAILEGSNNWRLHLWVMFRTFILCPILWLLFQWWHPVDVSPQIYSGFVYLCVLPATVQSAIAFTSMAGGNVAAAVCSASASSLLGIFVSPLLVSMLMHVQGDTGNGLEQMWHIILQLLVPFMAGHLLRPLIGKFVDKHKKMIGKTDRTSILLVVYTAFSEAVTQGIWHKVGLGSFAFIVVVCVILVAIVIVFNTYMARWMGFNKAEEITIVFCGSKKSLANGIPLANILFPVSAIGMMVLPLMIFHQVQLMICAVLAKRYHNKQLKLENEKREKSDTAAPVQAKLN